jgi:hypothetical protein
MAHLMAVQFVSDLTSDSRVGPRINENRLRLSEQAADHRPLARLKICRLGVSDLARTDILLDAQARRAMQVYNTPAFKKVEIHFKAVHSGSHHVVS